MSKSTVVLKQQRKSGWKSLIPVLVVFCVICSQLISGQMRTWTSSDGSKIKAEYISANDDAVTVSRASDRRRFTIPLERLSEEDQEWVAAKKDFTPFGAKRADAEEGLVELIQLPLRVYLINDIELEQKGVTMDTWVKQEDFSEVVLPEINRIWKPAGVEWVLDEITEQPAARVRDREDAITFIQNAKRNAAGKSDPARMPKIHAFCDKEKMHPTINNLYLFPYLGQTSQGNAAMRGNYAVVGLWTDKPSGGLQSPKKVALVEKGAFKVGSLARTCAHELGHNLGLVHPDKATQTRFNRLMGGRKHGYELVPEEVALAREIAAQRAKIID